MSRHTRHMQASAQTFSHAYPRSYGGVGSYMPSSTTTGVPDGVILTRYPASGYGDLVITTDGTVIDSLDVYGRILVQAAHVTIQRCKVRGSSGYSAPTPFIHCNYAATSNVVIRDTTVVPDFPSEWTVGVDGHDWVGDRLDLYNLHDCVRMRSNSSGASNVVLQRSWLHDLTYYIVDSTRSSTLQTHNDLIQMIGAVGAHIKGNFLNARYGAAGQYQPGVLDDPTQYGALSSSVELAAMMHNFSTWQTSELEVEDNWIFGGYTPSNSGDPGLAGANLGHYWRNRFDRAEKRGVPPNTLRFRADQIADCAEGAPTKCNVWDDNDAEIVIRRDG